MFKSKLLWVVTLSLAALLLVTCANPAPAFSEDDARKMAEDFVKKEATFTFDGIPETLKLTDTKVLTSGWEFTFEYDSRHGGYGDRTGQIVTQVITHHKAVLTVEGGRVSSAIMDWKWDMIKQKTIGG